MRYIKHLGSSYPPNRLSRASWRQFLLPSGRSFLAGDQWLSPVRGLEVLTPGLHHPLVFRPSWLRAATLRSRLNAARQRLLRNGAARIALYVWRYEFASALDLIPHDFSCYHIDDEYSFSVEESPNNPEEVALIRRVDQVIVHSPALMGKKGHINPRTALIPNGVDYSSYVRPQPEPFDLRAIPRPCIGYTGLIKKQLDLDLLVRLARARQQWSFVLVGPLGNVSGKEASVETLRRLSNVHFLGNKPVEALPGYAQHFDVCLMCYEVNSYTNYIYPLKLNEYLATGRPTVSSPIRTALGYSEFVSLASTDEEWLAHIGNGLAEPESSPLKDRRRAQAKERDWAVLVERVADLFSSGLNLEVGGVSTTRPTRPQGAVI